MSKKYNGDFKIKMVENIKNENFNYTELLKRLDISLHFTILSWERIYPEEVKIDIDE